MKKLTTTRFASLGAPEGRAFPGSAKAVRMRRPSRRTLVCVWTRDLASGRLVCSWVEPAHKDDDCNFGEPPLRFALAA
jgi:hypothetical protein